MTKSGNYCDIANPIRPSKSDTLTEETKRNILTNELNYEKFCGGKK